MIKYQDNITARLNGGALQPVAGATISVSTRAGAPAVIYADDGVTIKPQPLVTDNNGHFEFRALNGEYVLTISAAQFATFTREIELLDVDDVNEAMTSLANVQQTTHDALALVDAELVAIAGSGGAAKVGYGTDTVAGSLDALQMADYTALRAYSGARKNVYVTDLATAGMFVRDDADTAVLGTPVNAAFSTAITGGTLAAGTYSYRVSAIDAYGETLASTETSIAAAKLAAPAANAPTTATTGGTLAAATYYYKVTALGAAGETVGSNEVSIATTGTTSTVTITWGAVTGATGYRVYRGTAAGGQNAYYAPGNVTTFTDTGAASTAGSVPTANTATTNTNTVTVNWGVVTGATGYKVYGRTAGAQLFMASLGAVTTWTDTGSITPAGALPTGYKKDNGSTVIQSANGKRWKRDGFIQAGTGAVLRTMQDKARERMTLTDYGGIVANGSDQTANIIAWLGTLPADYTGLLIAPNGLRFNADQVYDALPVRAILRDDSAINAWDTEGGRARVIGWAERGDGTAITDLTNVIASSGHNASTGLDNRGTAGSNSANALVAAFHWFSGRLKKGQPGQRQLSRWEWAKIDGQQKWAWLIRKFVPWAAKNWEYWYPSTSYAAGATILSNAGRLYKTTAGGTTGATEPTHTSGTASDGGVSWEYMTSDHDSTIFAVGENGEIATNTAPVSGVMAYFKASTETPGAAIVIAEATGSSAAVEFRLSPTDGAGGVVLGPRLRATAGSMALVGSDYTRTGFVASDARGVELASYGHAEIVAAAGDTTPSVLNCGLLVLANPSATSVTTLDDGAATQEVTLFFENANTTLVHNGGGFLLKGGINVTPPTNSMLVMKRYSRSGAWFEKTRSF